MISMQGVTSALILRNESWVRKQASALARRLPSNVEKADLIQAGLIAVAQAYQSFVWEGSRDTDEAKEAFVRYARLRVQGAMVDELRQMDYLSRSQRRKVKVVQVARERWREVSDHSASAAELSALCGLSADEIFELESQAMAGQSVSMSSDAHGDDERSQPEPATEHDEVEARVDTSLLMRRLESFFAALPERDRQVIDAYLGLGLSPVKLAQSMKISPARISQLFKSICERIGLHLAPHGHRATDHAGRALPAPYEQVLAEREAELARAEESGAWTERLAEVLFAPPPPEGTHRPPGYIEVTRTTRWG